MHSHCSSGVDQILHGAWEMLRVLLLFCYAFNVGLYYKASLSLALAPSFNRNFAYINASAALWKDFPSFLYLSSSFGGCMFRLSVWDGYFHSQPDWTGKVLFLIVSVRMVQEEISIWVDCLNYYGFIMSWILVVWTFQFCSFFQNYVTYFSSFVFWC